MWLESRKEAYVAQEDIRDYFYRLGLDVRRAPCFGLPEIRVSALVAEMDAAEFPQCLSDMEPSLMVNSTFAVMPMGFS